MFRQLEDEYSFASWAIQLVVACLAPEIALMLIVFLPLEFLSAFPAPPANVEGRSSGAMGFGLEILFFTMLASLSAGVAGVVSRIWRNAVREGRFTFIIPAALTAFVFLRELLSGHGRELYDVLTGAAPGEESGWIFAFLIFPAFSTCVYSVTMWWLNRQRSLRAADGRI